jgi:dTDP-4-dehydrorhamnose 3,5-epimerase
MVRELRLKISPQQERGNDPMELKREDTPAPASNQGACLQFLPTNVSDAVIVDPIRREDHRGYFARKWCMKEFTDHGIDFIPLQASVALNLRRGTIRGMHLQVEPALEAKLIHCTQGSLFDVVLDLRPESATYGKWHGTVLSAENQRMLYIPERCGHGYQTLEDSTVVYYLTSQYFTPSTARGVRFDDRAFRIEWPLTPTTISEQDRNWPPAVEGSPL